MYTPLDPSVDCYERGRDHFDRNEFDAARSEFEKALELNPKNVSALTGLAAVLVNAGQPDDALPHLNEALRLDPRYAKAYSNRGVILERKGQIVEAIEDFTAAIKCDPKFGLAYLNRGRLLARIGRSNEGLADYSAAMPFERMTPSFWRERGTFLAQMGRYDEALTDYAEAQRLAPESADVYVERASILYNQGDLPHALIDCNEALQIDPESASALCLRATARERLGGRDAALADYNAALLLAPDRADIYLARGNLFQALPDLDLAEADYTDALQLDPTFSNAWLNRGLVRTALERYDDALADYTEAIRLEPESIHAYVNRGTLFSHLERFSDAIADFTEAIRLDPTHEIAYAHRAEARSQIGGQRTQALADRQTAARLNLSAAHGDKLQSFKRSVLSWSAVIAVALIVLHFTLNPALATIVVCGKFGLDDLLTAIWVRHRDPWTARGRSCSWLCTSFGILKIVIAAFIAGCLWSAAIGVNQFVGAVPAAVIAGAIAPMAYSIAATFVVGLPLQFLLAAGGTVIARLAGVPIWLDGGLSVARRDGKWPPMSEMSLNYGGPAFADNRMNLLLGVMRLELFLSAGLSLVCVFFLLGWGADTSVQWLVSTGIAALLALMTRTMKPVVALTPFECWYSPQVDRMSKH